MSKENTNGMNPESRQIDIKIHSRAEGFVSKVIYNHVGDIAYIGDRGGRKIVALSTSDNKIVGCFEGHNGIIWDMDLSDDDNILMSCSGDLSVILWDAKTGNGLSKIELLTGIPEKISIQKGEQTKYAMICFKPRKETQKLMFFDLSNISERMVPIKVINWDAESPITSIKWLNGGKYLVGCKNGNLILRDFNNDEFVESHNIHTDAIQTIEINRLKTIVLTSSLDKTVKETSLDGFGVLKNYNSPVPVNCAIYTKKDREVVIAGGIHAIKVANVSNNDFGIKFFRSKDQKLVRQIIYHNGPVRSMSASPIGNNIITGSQDGTAVVYILQAETEEDNQESEDAAAGFKQVENITSEEENHIYKLVGTYLKDDTTQVYYVNNPRVVARNNNNNSNDNNTTKEDEFTIDSSFIMERMKKNQEENKKEQEEKDEDLFTFNFSNSNTNSNTNSNPNTYTSSTSSASNEASQRPSRELTTIRVSNFPSSSFEDAKRWLAKEFSDHGDIQRINLDTNPKSVRNNGIIGYVTYFYKSCAIRAVELKNGARVEHQVLCVELVENRY